MTVKTSQPPDPMVEFIDVEKHYTDGDVMALDGVSFSIDPGEFVAVVGPSGCGKSTLLNMMGAIDRPSGGAVRISGTTLSEIENLDHLRAREIGFVFQSFHLIPNLTAVENIQIPMFGSDRAAAQRRIRAKELLRSVELQDRGDHFPHQLSNGQRQRVAIARALANQPKLVLADEPTGALDSENGKQVMDLLTSICRERAMTLVVVTHDEQLAEQADRILRMKDGRIVEFAIGYRRISN